MNQVTHLSHLIAALALAPIALAQTPANGTISGSILSEDARALHATVTLSLAAAQGYPAPPRRVFTGTNGAFTFTKLPAGKYVLCAQVSASEVAPANSPYVDTCVWRSGQAPITLAAGQQVAGVVFTAPKGTLLQVRVADPEQALPQASAKAPAPLEPELQVMLKGPDGLVRHARFVSSDSAGRNYQMAIPLKTALALKVTSNVANVFDQTSKQLQPTDETGIQPTTAADLGPLTFTVHKK